MMAIQLSEDRISLIERQKQIIYGLHTLPGQIKSMPKSDKTLQALANTTLANSRSLVILERGLLYATCLKGALKIKEISYMHCSQGMSCIFLILRINSISGLISSMD